MDKIEKIVSITLCIVSIVLIVDGILAQFFNAGIQQKSLTLGYCIAFVLASTKYNDIIKRKVAHRKHHRGRLKGNAKGGNEVSFSDFGIQALEPGWITARQIEAGRIAVTRYMKRQGQVWIRIFPDKPVTKKPAEVRMGKGKGAPEYWAATVNPGRIIFEVDGIDLETAKEALRLAAQKLPIRTKFIIRRDLQK